MMIQQIIDRTFLGNRILDYLICLSIFIASFIVIKIFRHVFLRRLKKWSEKTKTTLDDFLTTVLRIIFLPLAYFGAFYWSINTLNLNPLLKKTINTIGVGVLTLFAVRLATMFINYGFDIYLMKRGGDQVLRRSLEGILRVIKIVIWGLAVVFFLDNLGFKISAVIAGLGIGGVAVALAAQAVLGDLFSYFAILFDRPFEIGDFIITDDYMGTIERVGIKTTRIRSLSGEQLIFSNTDLTNSRVRNYKRMERRRVLFRLGVTYPTSLKHVKLIPDIIKNIMKGVNDTVLDRVHFFSFGDFSLIFEIVYYVIGADYNKYMDIQQEINFAIKEKFEAEGIEFAYPTQTLYVTKGS